MNCSQLIRISISTHQLR